MVVVEPDCVGDAQARQEPRRSDRERDVHDDREPDRHEEQRAQLAIERTV